MLNRSDHIESVTAGGGPGRVKHGIFRRIVAEIIQFALIAIYLWAMFGIFALHQSIIDKEHGVDYHFYGFAVINSLILGKVVLIAEDLHFADWFKNERLIYAIICKAVAFATLLIIFYIAEETIVGVIHGKGLNDSIPKIGGDLRGTLFVWVILAIALLPFFAFREIDAALGGRKLRAMVLMRRKDIAPIVSGQGEGG